MSAADRPDEIGEKGATGDDIEPWLQGLKTDLSVRRSVGGMRVHRF